MYFCIIGNENLEVEEDIQMNTPTQEQELEAEVQVEKQGAATLQEKFKVLLQKFVESEAARDKNLEEIEALKKHAEETDAILRRLFNVNNK